ncbi:hypothetical protein [Piscinibacter defluvii]|uniref:hypothetical protein n=1 Tax=Piscinibacter defluvii TaxID=1796922 RepID=UPI000FDE9E70|nr:hypothetical protein [Piscinibacter defluvii]
MNQPRSKGRSVDRRPQHTESWWWRTLEWLFEREIRFVLLFAIIFAAAVAVRVFGVSHWSLDLATVQIVASLLIIGSFLGVVVATDSARAYRKSGLRIRTVSGLVAGAGVALVFGAPFEAAALCALVGGVLGYFGMRWAQHI